VTRRSYTQHCGLARALDVIGERWTLLIVRELELGPKRFTELANRLPRMGRNLLTERLRQLEADGVIEHRDQSYALTPLGEDLRPAMEGLATWGLRLLEAYPSTMQANPVWAALTMRAGGDHSACIGVTQTCEFHVEQERFVVHMNDGEVRVLEGVSATEPDALVRCPVMAFMALGMGLSMPEAKDAGWLQIEGDPDVVRRCFDVLSFPPYPAMDERLSQMGASSSPM
jgi:DNA-binding HxlR family transcriptional regulator